MLHTQWYAAAACGSRSSTSRLICGDTFRLETVSANVLPSFDPSVTRLRLMPLRYTQRYAADARGSRSRFLRLICRGTIRSGTVYADARRPFDPSVTRRILLPLLHMRRYAAAACGSRSSTSRLTCGDTILKTTALNRPALLAAVAHYPPAPITPLARY